MTKQDIIIKLKQKRKEIAKQLNTDTFKILHNKTIEDIAEIKPCTVDELAKIKGIGPKKLEQFGKIILDIIINSTDLLAEENKEKIFTVSEFIDSINEVLTLQHVIVQGEVGEKINKYPQYTIFNLLDKKEEAVLKCFVWQKQLDSLGIELKSGTEVRVSGFPEIFKKRGDFTFQVEKIGLVGEGVLKQAFEMLRKKLAQTGFFDLARKKPIPKFCQKIGLITSRYGKGALPDFQKHLGNYGFQIYFYDVRVEGFSAIDDIVEAIRWFNENMLETDVLILTRGGGSWESLQPFNSEMVAKAIFGSKIPIICGVGHETDETIADYVADLRASTPTDAARVLSDPWRLATSQIVKFEKYLISSTKKIFESIKERITFFKRNLTKEIQDRILLKQEKLKELTKNLIVYFRKEILLKRDGLNNLMKSLNFCFQNYFKKFEILENEFKKNYSKIETSIKNQKLKVNQFLQGLTKNKDWWKEKIRKLLKQEEEKLILSSPVLKLKQGYTITSDEFEKIIKDPVKLEIDQTIKTKFYKGQILSKVKKVQK